jgi:hypothetical protein
LATKGINLSTISPIEVKVFSKISPLMLLDFDTASYAATAPPKEIPYTNTL